MISLNLIPCSLYNFLCSVSLSPCCSAPKPGGHWLKACHEYRFRRRCRSFRRVAPQGNNEHAGFCFLIVGNPGLDRIVELYLAQATCDGGSGQAHCDVQSAAFAWWWENLRERNMAGRKLFHHRPRLSPFMVLQRYAFALPFTFSFFHPTSRYAGRMAITTCCGFRRFCLRRFRRMIRNCSFFTLEEVEHYTTSPSPCQSNRKIQVYISFESQHRRDSSLINRTNYMAALCLRGYVHFGH